MPLSELLPDIQPTEAEIEAIAQSRAHFHGTGAIAYTVARLIWKSQRISTDPDSFPVALEAACFSKYGGSYGSYLKCDVWQSIQQRAFERSDHLCECCGQWARAVHIRDYRQRVLAGHDLTPLVAVCLECRDYLHEDPLTGRERNTLESEAVLAEIHGSWFGPEEVSPASAVGREAPQEETFPQLRLERLHGASKP